MPELEYLFYGKLEEVERNLRKANVKFLRIRKSLLVNTRFIKEYSADRVVLDNGREVEISKNYRDHVRQHYISMLKGRRWEWCLFWLLWRFFCNTAAYFCDSTLKKKKIRRYTDYLVWGGYFAVFNGVTYVLTYLGDGTSNIWLNILLFVCIFLWRSESYILIQSEHWWRRLYLCIWAACVQNCSCITEKNFWHGQMMQK